MATNSLQAIVYNPQNQTLEILDQLLLPHHSVYIPIKSTEDGFHAIKDMRVRGAPAIAIVAALAVAVEQSNAKPSTSESADDAAKGITSALQYLFTSRPTAVNLGDAVRKLTAVVDRAAQESGSTAKTVRDAYVAAAQRMLVDDVSDNQAIGRHGADWVHKNVLHGSKRKVGMLTVCNTGSLATAGYGTALGVIRSLHADGRLSHAYYCETRPYNQGSRLTGYELLYDKIPCTLITDSMACSLLSTRTSDPKLEMSPVRRGKVQKRAEALWAEDIALSPSDEGESRPLIGAIVVGADRVVANGDTANKIGTYSLAVLARHHGVKFLVAAPRTTIDLHTPSGAHIEIEERKEREVLVVKGPIVTGTSESGKVIVDLEHTQEVSLAPLDTEAWNPAFDVTPAELIDGIVTELGVVEKGVDGTFDLAKLFDRKEAANGQTKEMPDPADGP